MSVYFKQLQKPTRVNLLLNVNPQSSVLHLNITKERNLNYSEYLSFCLTSIESQFTTTIRQTEKSFSLYFNCVYLTWIWVVWKKTIEMGALRSGKIKQKKAVQNLFSFHHVLVGNIPAVNSYMKIWKPKQNKMWNNKTVKNNWAIHWV